MKMSPFVIGLAACLALLSACGGGGGSYTLEAGDLQPWQLSDGVCVFDNEAAEQQAMREGADCWRTVFVGNSGPDGWWPAVSWPSTQVLWRQAGEQP